MIQFVSFPLALILAGVIGIPGWLGIGLQALMAVAMAYAWSLPSWWILIHALFGPLVAISAQFDIPAWVWGVALGVCYLFLRNSVRDRVPLYLTSDKGYEAIAAELKKQPRAFRFVDLGCGWAGPLVSLSKLFPKSHFEGVETAPVNSFVSWFRTRDLHNVIVRHQDLWSVDLGNYDVVYTFLSPEPMPKLWEKFMKEARPGALFISNTFEIPRAKTTRERKLFDWRGGRLYIYQKPLPQEKLPETPLRGEAPVFNPTVTL